jgi:hypothetical protein
LVWEECETVADIADLPVRRKTLLPSWRAVS